MVIISMCTAPETQHRPLALVQAHCSNLARKSMGSSFKTSERKAMASSESAQEGSVVSRIWVRVKNTKAHTPVCSDRFLILENVSYARRRLPTHIPQRILCQRLPDNLRLPPHSMPALPLSWNPDVSEDPQYIHAPDLSRDSARRSRLPQASVYLQVSGDHLDPDLNIHVNS
jgi:hypothetical protein